MVVKERHATTLSFLFWFSQIVCVVRLIPRQLPTGEWGVVNCLKVCVIVCTVSISKSEMTSQPGACWDSRPKEGNSGWKERLHFAHTGFFPALSLRCAYIRFFFPHCFLQTRTASKHKQADSSILLELRSLLTTFAWTGGIIPRDKGRPCADCVLGLTSSLKFVHQLSKLSTINTLSL